MSLQNEPEENNTNAIDVEKAQKDIETAERTRIIWEILLQQIGLTYENTFREVGARLSEINKKGTEGANDIAKLMQFTQKQTRRKPNKNGGVSVSN